MTDENMDEALTLAMIEQATETREYYDDVLEQELPFAVKQDDEIYINVKALGAFQVQIVRVAEMLQEHDAELNTPIVNTLGVVMQELAVLGDTAKLFVGEDPRPINN